MTVRRGKAPLCVGLSELQAYARIERGDEEALLAGLLRSASESCETFTNQVLMLQDFEQELTPGRGWTMLSVQPVRSVGAIILEGAAEPLPPERYRVDIDHDGRAFVSGLVAGTRCTVRGLAGLGSDPNQIPEPLRQGILRLAAHFHAHRDGPSGELPAAVSSLWRPYRRAGLLS